MQLIIKRYFTHRGGHKLSLSPGSGYTLYSGFLKNVGFSLTSALRLPYVVLDKSQVGLSFRQLLR